MHTQIRNIIGYFYFNYGAGIHGSGQHLKNFLPKYIFFFPLFKII